MSHSALFVAIARPEIFLSSFPFTYIRVDVPFKCDKSHGGSKKSCMPLRMLGIIQPTYSLSVTGIEQSS